MKSILVYNIKMTETFYILYNNNGGLYYKTKWRNKLQFETGLKMVPAQFHNKLKVK